MAFRHEPVLLQEVLQWMNVRENGVYCDGTLDGGGHSEAILKASGGTAKLYGIDRDETAIRAAAERLKDYAGSSCWLLPAPAPWTAYCWTWAYPVPSSTQRNADSAIMRTRRWICAWTGAAE